MLAADVLEAPDEAIAAAVREALIQWRFAIVTNERLGQAWPSGKLTFYFVPGGRGAVLNPDDIVGSSKEERGADGAREGEPRQIDERGLGSFLAQAKPTIVDLSSRSAFRVSHLPGAVNIPLPELWSRALAELPRSDAVLLDCSKIDENWCGRAVRALGDRGYRRIVSYLPRGRTGS